MSENEEVVLDPGTGLPLEPVKTEETTVAEGEVTAESLPETPVAEESNETGTNEEASEAGSDTVQE